MTLDLVCAFCGDDFSYEYPGRGIARSSCDSCRTQTARQARSDARHADRVKAYKAKWARDNAEKMRRWSRRYYANHAEERRAASAAYRAENHDAVREYDRRYKAARGQAVVVAEFNRRSRKRGAVGKTSPAQLAARFAFYGNCCAYCRGPAESVDHVIPLARGGTNWPANLRPSCIPCNASKKDRLLVEWRQ